MLRFSPEPEVAEQQLNAIIFYLTASGYIDGELDSTEKTFIKIYIRRLVAERTLAAMPDATPGERDQHIARSVGRFHQVFERIDGDIRAWFDEAIAGADSLENFVNGRLKLRCYEIFGSFEQRNRRELLTTLDELSQADGKIHPAEARFRAELEALLDVEVPHATWEQLAGGGSTIALMPPMPLAPRRDDHPLWDACEEHYAAEPARRRAQVEADLRLMGRVVEEWRRRRGEGAGRLVGKRSVAELVGPPFLDGHVHGHPVAPGQRYELTVLGDLHGCYSCLKAAVAQADFFAKVEAYRLDPTRPNPKLVLLGDYIDRGRFSYNGILRTVMQLYCAAPDHVYMLRGNHEHYVAYQGQIHGAVRPAEALASLSGHLPVDVLEAYMRFFEEIPHVLLFDRLLFVHAGMPRDATLARSYVDLSSLNRPELRFEMLWSDPSSADYVPDELQQQSVRFPFGWRQFERFMNRLGCAMMVRGHEKIEEGFRSVYPGGPVALLNLFSAGGSHNEDLPPESSYRAVTPMALTIHVERGSARVVPWEIAYRSFNDPRRNRYFASEPALEHKLD